MAWATAAAFAAAAAAAASAESASPAAAAAASAAASAAAVASSTAGAAAGADAVLACALVCGADPHRTVGHAPRGHLLAHAVARCLGLREPGRGGPVGGASGGGSRSGLGTSSALRGTLCAGVGRDARGYTRPRRASWARLAAARRASAARLSAARCDVSSGRPPRPRDAGAAARLRRPRAHFGLGRRPRRVRPSRVRSPRRGAASPPQL